MSKYNARRTEVDGITFDSQAEARRYQELRLLEHAGAIKELVVHVPYPIRVNDVAVCTYVADFVYFERTPKGWQLVIEDVKGVRTDVYRLKKKLLKAVYGYDVREVEA